MWKIEYIPHPPLSCMIACMPELSGLLAHFTESVIRRLTLIKDEHGGINLSQGFPDFDPPTALLEAAIHTATEGPHQYATTWGARNFREAITIALANGDHEEAQRLAGKAEEQDIVTGYRRPKKA